MAPSRGFYAQFPRLDEASKVWRMHAQSVAKDRMRFIAHSWDRRTLRPALLNGTGEHAFAWQEMLKTTHELQKAAEADRLARRNASAAQLVHEL